MDAIPPAPQEVQHHLVENAGVQRNSHLLHDPFRPGGV